MINVEIEGLDLFIQSLSERAVSEQDLLKACALVERSAKQYAPKGTGELRNSITSRVEREGNDLVGIVFTPVEYAPYVEYGTGLFAEGGNGRKDVPWSYQDDKGEWHSTSGMSPQPFMRPALNENRERIIQIIKEGIGDD